VPEDLSRPARAATASAAAPPALRSALAGAWRDVRALVAGTVAACLRFRVTGLAAEGGFFAFPRDANWLIAITLLAEVCGALGDAARAGLPMDLVVARELQVLGSHGMPAGEYPAMLAMISAGTLDPRRLVGSVITLHEAPAALAALDDPSAAAGITVVQLGVS